MNGITQNTGLGFELVLPRRASDYLRSDHPRLQELQRRYSDHPAARHSVWSQQYLATGLRLDKFRGDNVYVHQRRAATHASYILTAHYVQSIDKLGLLSKLDDDSLFGNHLVNIDGQLSVSRELLDAVLEINFLDEMIGLARMSSPVILDIGAGYGRLAHRLVQSIPNLRTVFCTDAIPESTFLSEFYLRFRGCESKARVLPLDEVEDELQDRSIDIAINVHSFGECTLQSIEWWLALAATNRIKYLFIVPNGEALKTWEADDTAVDYLPLLLERGYKLVVKQPNYVLSPAVQKRGLYPCYYYLFERN
jgi:SAM-dependent methyltransferase